jgi:hypothetical protein
MATTYAEELAEEKFRDSLIVFVRMICEGTSNEELHSYYDGEVSKWFHSLAIHKCSDWAEANLEAYLPKRLQA